ncbi:MAG: primosomal protein N' [Deltaproteobacteria bacterium]|nr:primosomal protein N' [Deltaproteobacteria bacterium]
MGSSEAERSPRYAEIAVPLPLEGTFHYEVPEGLELRLGHRVLVPFGGRRLTGFVLGLDADLPPGLSASKVKSIIERLDLSPLLPVEVLTLIRFAADYYVAPLGLALETSLPPGLASGTHHKLSISRAGRRALETGVVPGALFMGDEERAVLSAAAKKGGAKVGGIKPSTAKRLIELGLVVDRESMSLRSADEVIDLVEATRSLTPGELARAKVQSQLFDELAKGPRPVSELVVALGAKAYGALRALERRGLLFRFERKVVRAKPSPDPTFTLELTLDQRGALSRIEAAIEDRKGAFLLRGITGSGKTEVYLRAIAKARKAGLGGLVLVPEIALTSQLEARFRAHFGSDVVVLHSGLGDTERRLGWGRLLDGQAGIALGARSAVWAPVQHLGVVVVDEEHDSSFKQNTELRYNGRDLAMFRAHKEGAVAILGSATPSLEAVRLASEGRLIELSLASRATGRSLPHVQIVDLSTLPKESGERPLLSRTLDEALRDVVSRGEQAILFLNRRGFNLIVACDECGAPRRCSRCSVTLIFHKRDERMVCHYCGHEELLFTACGACGSKAMKPYGAGTERIASFVGSTIPGARVLRLDRDVTQSEGALIETLEAFRNREANVLVGTQMVAKGHDFPLVTLVGILLADASLAVPDFRAAERTFQLITQVAGRAGRASLPGRVILQALAPSHYSIQCAIRHDDRGFVAIEAQSRKSAGYPPYSRLCSIRVESEDQELARAFATSIRREVDERIRREPEGTKTVFARGPAPAPIERIRGRFRFLSLVFAPTPARLSAIIHEVRARSGKPPRGVDVVFDVDAVDLL